MEDKQTDQHGYTTSYTYDGADRLIAVTDVLGNTTRYDYDEVGNMTSVTDANGNITCYTYDDFGRVIKITNALGQTAEVTYDISGNVLTSTDYAGNLTTYTSDGLDRVSSKTTPDGVVKYAYTTDGKLSVVTDNSGTTSLHNIVVTVLTILLAVWLIIKNYFDYVQYAKFIEDSLKTFENYLEGI